MVKYGRKDVWLCNIWDGDGKEEWIKSHKISRMRKGKEENRKKYEIYDGERQGRVKEKVWNI